MSKKWCKIIEIYGNQVLFTNEYDTDTEESKMSMTIKAYDWVEGCSAGTVKVSVSNSERDFTEEEFDRFTHPDCAEKIIRNDLIPELKKLKG